MPSHRAEFGVIATTALAAGFALGHLGVAKSPEAWAATAIIVALFLFTFFRLTR